MGAQARGAFAKVSAAAGFSTTIDLMADGPIYEFGPFRYDAGQRLLFRDDKVVPLVPKAIDTLHVLLERRGRVVDKSELIRLVWPDTVVEDVGLARNISLLRKALEDDAGSLIETVPKRGYRFSAAPGVSPHATRPAAASAGASGQRTKWGLALAAALVLLAVIYWQFYRPSRYLPGGRDFASIALLPFEPLSPAERGFAAGLDEVVVAELAKLDRVHVISPSTVRRYRALRIPAGLMARTLGVEVTLEGAVQSVAGHVRVTARLADVRSGKLIWAETYDPLAADAARAETETARSVAAQVGLHLGHRAR
ncbi:MAG TPA: winged helix-turn-helix domain-containing protein [Bryobacteraceae bacterium]|nr:winged helix-turn-helix domain-containing protein [Bryobacteraceae bacterium]